MNPSSPGASLRINPYIGLIVAGLAIGMIAALLNCRFYGTYGPFYDSMSYFNQLAGVMQTTRSEGFWPALRESYVHSTVFLPWLFGAALAYIAEPARGLGVVIQMPLLFLQLFTGYRYFRRVAGLAEGHAFFYAIPLVAYPALFHFNGGLVDFRMDLSQALAYGSFLAALLVARKGGDLREWVFAGLVLALACLVRATTPVYAVLVLAVAFLFDLHGQGVATALKRYLALGGTVLLLSGWFFVLNYEHLHYYYFIWNTDANARLAIAKSARHLVFIYQHIGAYLSAALVLAMLSGLFRLFRGCPKRMASLNWVALIGGGVPAAYLVLSGAGLNPFVSMVAVPGLILFALHVGECAEIRPTRGGHILSVIVAVALLLSLVTAIRGFDKGISDWIPHRKGVERLMDTVLQDARRRGLASVRISFLYLGSVDGSVINNHLMYDRGFKKVSGRAVAGDGMAVLTVKYGFGAEVDWAKIPGANDTERLDHLHRDARQSADFIVMADAGSRLPAHHRVNRQSDYARAKLAADPVLSVIVSGLALSDTEKVTVYRVDRPAPGGKPEGDGVSATGSSAVLGASRTGKPTAAGGQAFDPAVRERILEGNFLAADIDRDGYISRMEAGKPGNEIPADIGKYIVAMDANRDGRMSLKEYKDYSYGVNEGAKPKGFAVADADRSGGLSRQELEKTGVFEFPGIKRNFAAMDANRDGEVSLQERDAFIRDRDRPR